MLILYTAGLQTPMQNLCIYECYGAEMVPGTAKSRSKKYNRICGSTAKRSANLARGYAALRRCGNRELRRCAQGAAP